MAKSAKSPSKGSEFSKPKMMMEDEGMEPMPMKMGMKPPKSMPPWLKGGKGKGAMKGKG